MFASEENVRALSDLGLSPNQSKVYLSVLQTEGLPVRDITKTAKVNREEVYRVILRLEKMGLIEKILGHPIRLRSLPVEVALSNLIKIERNSFTDRMATLEVSTSEFVKRYEKTEAPKTGTREEVSNFVLLNEKNAIVNKGTTMIDHAKSRVDAIYSETQLLQFVPIFADALAKACEKGVKARLIADKKVEETPARKVVQEYLRDCRGLRVKYAERPASHSIIVDRAEALSATLVEGYFSEIPHLWTNNKGLVELLQVNFESVWEIAEPESIS
jgi:sugar-specific transcriptional regulator TrmB